MPISNPLRRCAALGAVVALALTGCSDESGGDPPETAEDHAALLGLGDRVSSAADHAYTAEYLVEGSDTSVLVAVDPDAEDAVVVDGDRTEFWPGPDSEDLNSWLSVQLAGVLPTHEAVAEWLNATAEDPSASAEFSDTTLAGELADCVNVRGASSSPVGAFEVCVTTVGVVASVTAEVGDFAYTAKLVNYHDGVDSTWLDELSDSSKHSNE